MPVVKGGVWTNVEDEILKASVSKYGLNQWARVSSLLARKTPKQCKARWLEWLDPGIRKIEWSKEEDEKLLHLAKLMPTQWRTIAPVVGRTATQCLERYQKLLDDAEARENEELGLGGPSGAEAAAPTADQVRRLRPGEMDPDPETKPARPDAVDMDEDEKEMLSEARARLANTQGKKAKRKARERQLEESRRLAVLQKRRELKHAGINIKLVNRKKGQMDYNADIPFEKKPSLGFYDTSEEQARNERQLQAFDPRKAVLQTKRKGDQEDETDSKRRKGNNKNGMAAVQAAAKGAQLQRLREAEQLSKRRQLVLPMPQVGDRELEDIVKMGMVGESANKMAKSGDNEATKGLIGDYSNLNSGAPIRTPRAAPQEDHIANEIRNIRALTEVQSSLLGGENTPLHEGSSSTGFDGVTPRRAVVATPNPLATPFRGAGKGGPGATPGATPAIDATPRGPGQTPLRTPRDSLGLNASERGGFVGETPRDAQLRLNSEKASLKKGFLGLPKPRETEWEFELPDGEEEAADAEGEELEEDSEERDKRLKAIREAEEELERKRQSQAVQQNLPRPKDIDINALYKTADGVDGIEGMIAKEMALLVVSDARKFPVPGGNVQGTARPLYNLEDKVLQKARMEILMELPPVHMNTAIVKFDEAWRECHGQSKIPGLDGYGEDELDEKQVMVNLFNTVQEKLVSDAMAGNKIEKKLSLTLGGYQNRSRMLTGKIQDSWNALTEAKRSLDSFKTLAISEYDAIPRRLESLMSEVDFLTKREAEGQALYKMRKMELDELVESSAAAVNGA